MKTLFLRKRFNSVAITLLMLSPSVSKMYGQNNTRSDFKKDFPNNLIANIKKYPLGGRLPVSEMNIDIQAEAQEVADAAMDTIVATLLRKNEVLAPMRPTRAMTKAYRTAVRAELGGSDVPVGLHCMRGAYTGIMSGINALGIEEKIVSPNAKDACKTFWSDWKKRFAGEKYRGTWYENVTVYKDYSDYMSAMEKFIESHNPKSDTDRDKLQAEFSKKNVPIHELDGSVFLTPRSKTKYHATFYPGPMRRDTTENYVRDFDGEPMLISFNREYISELFGNNKTKKISFVALVSRGIFIKTMEGYEEKIKSMERPELMEYLSQGAKNPENLKDWMESLPMVTLRNLATARYFGKNFHDNLPHIQPILPKIHLLDATRGHSM